MWLPLAWCLIFCAFNIYLWSLPLSGEQLFFIAVPLAVAYFWVVFRLYGRR